MNTRPIQNNPTLNHDFPSWLRTLTTNALLAMAAFQATASNAQEPSKLADPVGVSQSITNNTETSTPEATTIVKQARTAVIPIRVQHPHVVLVKDGDYVTPGMKLVEYDERVVFESNLRHERAKLIYEDNFVSHERYLKLRKSNAISEEELQRSTLATELSRIDFLLTESALQELLLVTPKFPGTVRLNDAALNPVITIREDISHSHSTQGVQSPIPITAPPLEPHSTAPTANILEDKK